MEIIIAGIGAICFIVGVFVGVIIYAVADGCFEIDLSRPHDEYD